VGAGTRPSRRARGAVTATTPTTTSARCRPAAGVKATPSRRFDQAQEVADKFKDGQAVIMNLEATEREISRRLIDFASGLCYALNGSMEKVATGVYLLKPPTGRSDYDDYDA
jgi:cell division inhibitor SepF